MSTRTFFAHSSPDHQPAPHGWQLLREHLAGVAKLAKALADAARLRDLPAAAEAAGWLHDLGKYRPEWQQYLLASAAKLPAKDVPHSVHGAAYCWTRWEHAPLAVVIAGHHSGLTDLHKLEERLKGIPAGVLETLVATARHESPGMPDALAPPDCEGSDEGMRRLEFWTRVLFSVLIDADRLDTAGRKRTDLALEPDRLLSTLVGAVPAPRAGSDPELTALRRRVFEQCIAAGISDQGFFELTVPTGGGKTRSGMAFALAHAKRHNLRRVFIVIPYLSIIEQNAREYRELFGRATVLEHHSAVIADESTNSRNDPYQSRSPAELAAENWDAPIVVTTSVQFLETLLAASPRRCRRLHSVARSVIVFDEAQCLPVHVLNPLLDVFRELTARYGCSIVFSTATQPAFRHSPLGLTHGLKPNELQPILPAALKTELYRNLQRVTFRNATATPWDWNTLVDQLMRSPALCVLNTRRHAREVWELLRAAVRDSYGAGAVAGVRHLSSSLCAQHRTDILGTRADPLPGTIYQRLRAGEPCWVVSTQVIEAGVDIDFPQVFRALGPLDSIAQAGGRCNREGSLRDERGNPLKGEVVIFRPVDESLPPGQYRLATGEALTLLSERPADELVTNPDLFARYFVTLYNRAATDARDIQAMRAEWKFDSVAQVARVIEDGGRSVIVPYRDGRRWIRRLRRAGTYDRSILRRLQRYTVNLRPNDFAEANHLGLVTPLNDDKPDGPWVLTEGCYHDDLGVAIAGRPLDDFLI